MSIKKSRSQTFIYLFIYSRIYNINIVIHCQIVINIKKKNIFIGTKQRYDMISIHKHFSNLASNVFVPNIWSN